MQDFPCSVHKDRYENCQIARDAAELDRFHEDGWLTSDEWYKQVMQIPIESVSEPEYESIRRKPGRPRKEVA